uniref:MARVEL domain-containing protein n=1 Tax=Salmo trutta TaxID=8032 RepID=A0A673X271_SALTR
FYQNTGRVATLLLFQLRICARASEQIFGGLVWILVWILVAYTHGGWVAADFAIHGLAALFYLTASVALAKVTIDFKDNTAHLKKLPDRHSIVLYDIH